MQKLLRIIDEHFKLFLLIILICYLLIYYQNAKIGRYVKLSHQGVNTYLILDSATGATYYLPEKTPIGKEYWSKLMPAVNK